MEAPAKIWTRAHEVFDENPGFPSSYGPVPTYIRSDLVDKLIGYAVHDRDCDQEVGWGKTTRCTCGLSDLIKELRG